MSNTPTKEIDLTATEIVDNFKRIVNEIHIIKHTMIKLLGDVNNCMVYNETINTILEEAEIAGPNENPETLATLIVDREEKADKLFKKIMKVTQEFSNQTRDMTDFQKLDKFHDDFINAFGELEHNGIGVNINFTKIFGDHMLKYIHKKKIYQNYRSL